MKYFILVRWKMGNVPRNASRFQGLGNVFYVPSVTSQWSTSNPPFKTPHTRHNEWYARISLAWRGTFQLKAFALDLTSIVEPFKVDSVTYFPKFSCRHFHCHPTFYNRNKRGQVSEWWKVGKQSFNHFMRSLYSNDFRLDECLLHALFTRVAGGEQS